MEADAVLVGDLAKQREHRSILVLLGSWALFWYLGKTPLVGDVDKAVSWQDIFNKQCWISTISLFICGIHQVFSLYLLFSKFMHSVLMSVLSAAQVHHPWNNPGKYRAESHQEGTILSRKWILVKNEKMPFLQFKGNEGRINCQVSQ